MTYLVNEDDFLAHYGVKGMRWGIRKDRKSGRKSASDVAKTLTDAELKKRVDRLQMEKRYVDLVSQTRKKDRTTFDRGVEQVTKMLTNAAKQKLQNQVNSAYSDVVDLAIGAAVSSIAKKRGG